MQTQIYIYYMHFLVLKESEQKCARALFVKKCHFFDSKSMLTSIIALGTFFLTHLKQICAKKIHLQRLKYPRARNERKYLNTYVLRLA